MDKNSTGGAKPKTIIGANNNNSNTRTGASNGSLAPRNQTRNRSPRRDLTYAPMFNSQRSTRGPQSPSRRSSIPISVARGRNGNTQRSNPSCRVDALPLSNTRFRAVPASLGSGGSNSSYSRPLLRPVRQAAEPASVMLDSVDDHLNNAVRPHLPDILPFSEPPHPQLQLPNLPPPSSAFQQLLSMSPSSEDSDSDPCSPDSLLETLPSLVIPPPLATDQPSSPGTRPSWSPRTPRVYSGFSSFLPPFNDGPSRPVTASRDSLLARDMLQEEMDEMVQRDEEIARQLQDELNRDMELQTPPQRPLRMFLEGGLLRSRHFPSNPARQDAGRLPGRGRDRRPAGLDLGLPTRRSRGARLFWGGRSSEERQASEDNREEVDDEFSRERESARESVQSPLSPVEDRQFDWDIRTRWFNSMDIFSRGADDPTDDDFVTLGPFETLSDPSVMLLMLLLRAPDTLYQNDGFVDLDDYEGLWELAERLGEVRHRGISDDQINQIPTLKYKSANEEAAAMSEADMISCQICLVDFENGDCLRSIPCKHDFHKDCIDPWLKRNATCPICRQDIKPQA